LDFINEQGIYVCPTLTTIPWLKHGFGSRHANPQADVTLRQIHSDLVRVASGLVDRECEGDALITDVPGQSIGIRTADCVPVLLADARRRVIAAVHAGWRGTAACIVKKAIEQLRQKYGTEAADLAAAIGPSIRACCYEVSPNVANEFSRWPKTVRQFAGTKPHVDLALANFLQMEETGVPASSIFDSQLCTACRTDLFFSFRREPANPGRMLSVIGRL
jgi:purine-nucleoside/S-methyl-5'-thioadenosine phosphorylase / adenosine deaminase